MSGSHQTVRNVRHELSEHEGMLFRGEHNIVVPYAYQKRALTCLHTGHLGIVKCTERSKTTSASAGVEICLANLAKDQNCL